MELNTHVSSSDESMPPPRRKKRKPYQRKNERIGGGHFVFKRNKNSGRIHPNNFAFEHPNHASALEEAERLHAETGDEYNVVSVANCVGDPDEPIQGGIKHDA